MINIAPILVINSGSSSLKAALFVRQTAQSGAPNRSDERVVLQAAATGIGQTEGRLSIKDADGRPLGSSDDSDRPGDSDKPGQSDKQSESDKHNYQSQAEALEKVAERLAQHAGDMPVAVGHRVVHGGMHLTSHQRITPALLDQLQEAIHFAPLHIPGSLELIRKAEELYPGVPQFACFDTAFHQTLPEVAWRLPIPEKWSDQGVRRYGFHGLSYESIVAQLRTAGRVPDRVIVAHLGSGSSLCAIERGRSIDTSMGLTPCGGVPMATRTGDLDPGVIIFLMRAGGLSLDDAEALVNHDSGLRGISGGISDMQKLEEKADSGSRPAKLAIEVFATAVAKTIAGYLVSLEGLDLLVFTGGIGEHSATLRSAVCERLRPLGVRIDGGANREHPDSAQGALISADSSSVLVRILPAQEDLQIARHVRSLLGMQTAL